ncbi:MAG: hypothetical protein GWN32_11260 [Gemmatimonadetes bacterium]|nr:hypothetical protein [Gemmatimonadota bacterium]
MRKSIVLPVLIALVAGCSEQPTAMGPMDDIGVQTDGASITASATGSGIILSRGRAFTFEANTDASGITTGNAQLSFSGPETVKGHVAIDCLVVDGNQATMSGHITSVHPPVIPGAFVGLPVWFRVVDKGEPPATDEITNVLFANAPSCDVDAELDLFPIEAGNVQVH